jgi:hypothetical protein
MDNAICGGAGATLTGTALAAVKAAIFMGDPHNRNGLPYNVGTCKAQGVSSRLYLLHMLSTNQMFSFPPVHQASHARPPAPPSSNPTAMLRTHTAALATTPMLTSSTSTSTDPRPLHSSRASSLHKWLARLERHIKRSQRGSDQNLRCKYIIIKRNVYMPHASYFMEPISRDCTRQAQTTFVSI